MKRIKPPADLARLAQDSPPLRELLHQIRAVAAQINLHGWAEANAGNISVNVSAELAGLVPSGISWFLVSRSGSRFRQLAIDPIPNLVLVSQDDSEQVCHPPDCRPTSEWLCHHLLQEQFCFTKSSDRVVLHSHPSSVILLSQLDIFQPETLLNQALCDALPELKLFLPEGVATSLYASPGSQELAQASQSALTRKKALIWQNHGLVCTGKTPDEALDIMEVIEKAALLALHKFLLTKNNS